MKGGTLSRELLMYHCGIHSWHQLTSFTPSISGWWFQTFFSIIYGIILPIRSWPEVPPVSFSVGVGSSRAIAWVGFRSVSHGFSFEPLSSGHSLQFTLLTDALGHQLLPGSHREYRLGLFASCFPSGIWSPSSTKNLGFARALHWFGCITFQGFCSVPNTECLLASAGVPYTWGFTTKGWAPSHYSLAHFWLPCNSILILVTSAFTGHRGELPASDWLGFAFVALHWTTKIVQVYVLSFVIPYHHDRCIYPDFWLRESLSGFWIFASSTP